jgi:hypothetical protein
MCASNATRYAYAPGMPETWWHDAEKADKLQRG